MKYLNRFTIALGEKKQSVRKLKNQIKEKEENLSDTKEQKKKVAEEVEQMTETLSLIENKFKEKKLDKKDSKSKAMFILLGIGILLEIIGILGNPIFGLASFIVYGFTDTLAILMIASWLKSRKIVNKIIKLQGKLDEKKKELESIEEKIVELEKEIQEALNQENDLDSEIKIIEEYLNNIRSLKEEEQTHTIEQTVVKNSSSKKLNLS